MSFELKSCVSYISDNITKKITDTFGRWLESYDITRIQWVALYFIYSKQGLSQRELARLMEINDSSALRLVDRLERDGMVKRVRGVEDRRIIHLEMTAKGTEIIINLMPVGEEFSQLLVKDISPEDLFIFQRVQRQMYENVMSDSKSIK